MTTTEQTNAPAAGVLEDLRERLRSATGPDRELDAAIAIQVGGMIGTLRLGHPALGNERAVPVHHPRYTSSIDAALALVERVLPGWTVANMSQQDDKTWFCELREGFLTSYGRVAMSDYRYDKRPPTLPLAILSALLSALISSKGEE